MGVAKATFFVSAVVFQNNIRTLRAHCMSHDIMPTARLATVRAAYGMVSRSDTYEAREELANFLNAGAFGEGGASWSYDRVERHTSLLARQQMLMRGCYSHS
jgi:hypothetical protein